MSDGLHYSLRHIPSIAAIHRHEGLSQCFLTHLCTASGTYKPEKKAKTVVTCHVMPGTSDMRICCDAT